MASRILCVSSDLWGKAADFLEQQVEGLERRCRVRRDEVTIIPDEDGIQYSPCTAQLWHRDVWVEHEEHTCYFRHWFKKVDGKLQACRFSHLALMKLVRSCVWQALLYEFVKQKCCARHAVRLRVEDELEHYSNCTSSKLRKRIGMLAQDWFNIVKHNLGANSRPLNRVNIASAERMVINMPGLDYRSQRKGWSNRKMRQELVRHIVDSRIAEFRTRGEQEAFVFRYIGSCNGLKQDAVKAIIRKLATYYNPETGECIIKPWSREELSAINSEKRTAHFADRVAIRVQEISAKMDRGEKLTNAEMKFKSVHRELFNSLTESTTNGKRKQVLHDADPSVIPVGGHRESKDSRNPEDSASTRKRKEARDTKLKHNFSLRGRMATGKVSVAGRGR